MVMHTYEEVHTVSMLVGALTSRWLCCASDVAHLWRYHNVVSLFKT